MVDKIIGTSTKIDREITHKVGKKIDFSELVKEAEIKFSAHAIKRITTRNIPQDSNVMQKLTNAVERAKTKGANECLVIMDNMAYIVSVKNKTVVTVVNKDELKEKIFTNIDSVVIA